MSARKWTQVQRQQQAEAIQRWKPWEQSTGPKSPGGKVKVSSNAYSGGEWVTLRESIKELNLSLRQQKKMLR